MEITRQPFERRRQPRFEGTNPERMDVPFWEWMVRGADQPLPNAGRVHGRRGLVMRSGTLKSTCGPWRTRDRFQVPPNRDDGPIWTFDRMGQSRTELPDGG